MRPSSANAWPRPIAVGPRRCLTGSTNPVDVLLGKKAIYRQEPHSFYFPGLPESQFYDRDQFAWLGAVEAGTDAIREEFEAVWRTDHGFTPYIEYPPGIPVDQWAELNHSPRWSAFHLVRNSARSRRECVPLSARRWRCLARFPAPTLPGRSPNAMFSLLKPRTRIPPHTGDTNVRLVVHIPLIIPEKTGFRVGNDTRPWRLGEALIFNDTIEHEAWNDSDQLRVVLIFVIWHPDLTRRPERKHGGAAHGLTSAFLGAGRRLRALSRPRPRLLRRRSGWRPMASKRGPSLIGRDRGAWRAGKSSALRAVGLGADVVAGRFAGGLAATSRPGRAELVKALSDCRAIADPTARLDCFDKTAAALDQAQTSGDVIVVDRKQVRAVKREAFGFNLNTLAILDRGPKDAADDTITAIAKSAMTTSAGKWIVTLEDGAVWRQVDDDPLSREPHAGSKIKIRKASLGSFLMNVDGQPSIRVHRDE